MIANLIDAFVADVCAGKTNETARSYRGKLAQLANFLEDQEINQNTIDKFKINLLTRKSHYRGKKLISGPLSRFTIRSVLSTTRHFLRWGYEHGHFQNIVLTNIAEPPIDPKAIAGETATRLLLAAQRVGSEWEQARNLALLYCLIDTGARSGTLARLELSNLMLRDGYATALGKGDNWCWLYFCPATVSRLEKWLELRHTRLPTDDLVWTGHRGHGMDRQAIARMVNRLADAAGVSGYRHNPHSFRHAFAREAILAGATLNQVAEMMGHRGIVVTHKYYARWERREVRKFHHRFSPGRNLE